jgi:two-component system, NarL family, nitrate/nitrite response regulator NarL
LIRVVVASDVRLYRDALAATLANDAAIRIVAVAALDSAIAVARRTNPAVLLLDAEPRAGSELISQTATACPTTRVIALAVPDSEPAIIVLAEAGVAALVARDDPIDVLKDVITRVDCGEAVCSPTLAGVLLQRIAAAAAERRRWAVAPLTWREAEVAELVAAGLANKEIALRLGIELATVKNHVHSILAKFDVRRRGEAAARVRASRREDEGNAA